MTHFDGRAPRALRIDGISEILDLPRFLYIRWRQGWSLALPKHAFAHEQAAHDFARRLARSAGIEPTWDVRSEWVGPRKSGFDAQLSKAAVWFAVVFFGGLWLTAVYFLLLR